MRKTSFLTVLSLFTLVCLSGGASIIRRPPVKSSEITYQDLVCSEAQKNHIYEIITTMADSSKLSLLCNQTHLKDLGDRINDVHPLKFLSSIFTDAHLKSRMGFIWNDYFKRTGFLDGLVPSLNREIEKGKLQALLPDFSKELDQELENIQGYFDTRDWSNLVMYLIQA